MRIYRGFSLFLLAICAPCAQDLWPVSAALNMVSQNFQFFGQKI